MPSRKSNTLRIFARFTRADLPICTSGSIARHPPYTVPGIRFENANLCRIRARWIVIPGYFRAKGQAREQRWVTPGIVGAATLRRPLVGMRDQRADTAATLTRRQRDLGRLQPLVLTAESDGPETTSGE